jgi:hypothetical protein
MAAITERIKYFIAVLLKTLHLKTVLKAGLVLHNQTIKRKEVPGLRKPCGLIEFVAGALPQRHAGKDMDLYLCLLQDCLQHYSFQSKEILHNPGQTGGINVAMRG